MMSVIKHSESKAGVPTMKLGRYLRAFTLLLVVSVALLVFLSHPLYYPHTPGPLSRLASVARGFVPALGNGSVTLSSDCGGACRKSLQLSRHPLPVTALCSVQGSGNTWLRYLLQELTGIYTGSEYGKKNDLELWSRGFHGEGIRNGSVVAIKTHELPARRNGTVFQKAILLIRNPYDAMFAEFNRKASGSHIGVARARAYLKYWDRFLLWFTHRWAQFYSAWSRFNGSTLLINFDNLVHNLPHEMERISAFIKHPSIQTDINCTLVKSTGCTKRSRRTFQKTELFNASQIQMINDNIDFVQSLFIDTFPTEVQEMTDWKLNQTLYKDVDVVMKINDGLEMEPNKTNNSRES